MGIKEVKGDPAVLGTPVAADTAATKVEIIWNFRELMGRAVDKNSNKFRL